MESARELILWKREAKEACGGRTRSLTVWQHPGCLMVTGPRTVPLQASLDRLPPAAWAPWMLWKWGGQVWLYWRTTVPALDPELLEMCGLSLLRITFSRHAGRDAWFIHDLIKKELFCLWNMFNHAKQGTNWSSLYVLRGLSFWHMCAELNSDHITTLLETPAAAGCSQGQAQPLSRGPCDSRRLTLTCHPEFQGTQFPLGRDASGHAVPYSVRSQGVGTGAFLHPHIGDPTELLFIWDLSATLTIWESRTEKLKYMYMLIYSKIAIINLFQK